MRTKDYVPHAVAVFHLRQPEVSLWLRLFSCCRLPYFVKTCRLWFLKKPLSRALDFTIVASVQDFYMEMHWSFECSNVLAPIVKAVAPHDHYRIWKKGSWLRMDSTITGK